MQQEAWRPQPEGRRNDEPGRNGDCPADFLRVPTKTMNRPSRPLRTKTRPCNAPGRTTSVHRCAMRGRTRLGRSARSRYPRGGTRSLPPPPPRARLGRRCRTSRGQGGPCPRSDGGARSGAGRGRSRCLRPQPRWRTSRRCETTQRPRSDPPNRDSGALAFLEGRRVPGRSQCDAIGRLREWNPGPGRRARYLVNMPTRSATRRTSPSSPRG